MSAVNGVLAHGATHAADGSEWSAILTVVALAAVGAGYGRGVHELWARRGYGAVVPAGRAVAFAAGLAVVLATQVGPVHDLAEHSFAGHMTQHMLLVTVAGPLLAAGAAGLPLSLATPHRLRRLLARARHSGAGRWLRRPAVLALLAAGTHTLVLWVWHLPVPYTLAVQQPAVHAVEHLLFIGAAWLLWAPVLGPEPHRLSPPIGFLLLFAGAMAASALGAVLTLAPAPLYPPEVLVPTGGDPLVAQQLAGLVMWVPMDVVVLTVAVVVFRRWLAGMERATPSGHDLRPETEVPA